MNEQNEMEQEVDAIKQAIMDYYHEGHAKSDPGLYEEILHDEWKFFYVDAEGKLQITDKAKYLSWYQPENYDESLEWETEFYYVDVKGTVGAAKIRLENQKVRYTDYFNLVKLKGKWWIVHKISHSDHKI